MLKQLLAATAAALVLAAIPVAQAADLAGDPYDDPRYADIYGDTPPPPPPRANRYTERYDGGGDERRRYKDYKAYDRTDDRDTRDTRDPRESYKDKNDDHDADDRRESYKDGDDNNDDYDESKSDRRRYANSHDWHSDRCVPRQLIKRELLADGWNEFYGLELQGKHALIYARRPSGRLFHLSIDRCSGQIVKARPADTGYGRKFASHPRGYWHGF